MKHFLNIVLLLIISYSIINCKKKEELNGSKPLNSKYELLHKIPKDGKYPKITFDTPTHDFGDIQEGEKVNCSFSFTNTGEADLVIIDAVGSCGCTIPKYPEEPIKPGEKKNIEVYFDSKGKIGNTTKTVTITSNCKIQQTILTIHSNIISKKNKSIITWDN